MSGREGELSWFVHVYNLSCVDHFSIYSNKKHSLICTGCYSTASLQDHESTRIFLSNLGGKKKPLKQPKKKTQELDEVKRKLLQYLVAVTWFNRHCTFPLTTKRYTKPSIECIYAYSRMTLRKSRRWEKSKKNYKKQKQRLLERDLWVRKLVFIIHDDIANVGVLYS